MPNPDVLSADKAVDWQREQWNAGRPISVEAILAENQAFVDNEEILLDLIYSEVLLREDLGQSPAEDEFALRFPKIADKIARQFQLHRGLLVDTALETDLATIGDTRFNTIGTGTKTKSIVRHGHGPAIPGFEILGVAGRGGNGVAFRAIDIKLRRTVAIKLLDVSYAADIERAKQLRREAEAAASLVHPNIVQVFQVGEIADGPYLVMEFIDGGSLAEQLRSGPMLVSNAIKLSQQVTHAIGYAHEKGIIHRDLKPGNILLDNRGNAHVCDFGLARKIGTDETLHATGDVVGTPAYMPPEQARGERVDQRADVYAIGAILYETLSGKPPFQAATTWEILHQVLTNDIVPLKRLNPSLPVELETICARCLEKDPAGRYATAAEVHAELERFKQGLPIQARPIGRLPRFLKWVRRNPGIAATVSVVALSLLSIAVVAGFSQQRVSEALVKSQDSLLQAEQQRDVAVDAMNRLVYQVHDDLQKREASVEARGEVLRSAIDGLQKIASVAGDREDTAITLATALARLGYILSQQGKNDDAEIEFLKSIDIADSLQSKEGRRLRAQNYANIALFYVRAANFQAVKVWAERTSVLAAELLLTDHDNLDLKTIEVQAMDHLATAASVLESPANAFSIRQSAQQAYAKLSAEHPESESIRNEVININLLLVQDCITIGRLGDAERYTEECLDLLRTQSPEMTEDVQVQRRYCTALRFKGIIEFSKANYDAGISHLETAIRIYSRLAALEPNRPGFHLKLGTMYDVMADCLLAKGMLDESEQQIQNQIAAFQQGIKVGGPTYGVQRYASSNGLMKLCGIQLRKNQFSEAAESARLAAVELVPILESYNTQEIHDGNVYATELIAALAGQESKSDPVEIEALETSVAAWQALMNKENDLFVAEEFQLLADRDNQTNRQLEAMLSSQLCLCYAQYYGNLIRSESASAEEIETAKAKSISSFETYLESPGADAWLHIRYPEFEALRQDAEFMSRFKIN